MEEGEANESSFSYTWGEIKVMHEGRSYDVCLLHCSLL